MNIICPVCQGPAHPVGTESEHLYKCSTCLFDFSGPNEEEIRAHAAWYQKNWPAIQLERRREMAKLGMEFKDEEARRTNFDALRNGGV